MVHLVVVTIPRLRFLKYCGNSLTLCPYIWNLTMSLNYVNQMQMGEGPVIFTQFGSQVGKSVCKNKICFVYGTENMIKAGGIT